MAESTNATGLRVKKWAGALAPARLDLRRLASADDGEVDVGLDDLVQLVRKAVLRDQGHDFHDLGVGVASIANRLDVVFADVAALLGHLGGEMHRCVGLGIAGAVLAVQRDLLRADLRQVQVEISVGRQAVVTAVGLCNGQHHKVSDAVRIDHGH